jgi:hypothetical protein
VELPKSNQQIFSDLIKSNIGRFQNQLAINGADKIYQVIFINKSFSDEFLLNNLRNLFPNYILISEDKNSKRNIDIVINELKLKINYDKIKTDLILNKKIKRNLSYSCSFEFRDSVNLYKGSVNDIYIDTVRYEDVDFIEKDEYVFTKEKLPEESFLEKILIPGIVIIASAVTIVLFFIIRTK